MKSNSVSLVKLIISVNAAGVIDGLDSLVKNAENNVNNARYEVDPEHVFECLTSAKVQKAELGDASGKVVDPQEQSIKDGHVCDEFPIIFLQDAVCAKGVYQAGSSWNRMDHLEVH